MLMCLGLGQGCDVFSLGTCAVGGNMSWVGKELWLHNFLGPEPNMAQSCEQQPCRSQRVAKQSLGGEQVSGGTDMYSVESSCTGEGGDHLSCSGVRRCGQFLSVNTGIGYR